jgi:hypothetical protein
MKKINLLVTALLITTVFLAQNVAITDDGSYTVDPSAMLDVKSTDKGMLIPRIDFNDKPTSPATGLLIYVTTNGPEGNNAFYYYNGSEWLKIADGSETKITAGTNVTVTGTGTIGNPYVINSISGVLAFAEYYAIMPSDNTATIAPGEPVDFPQNGPSSGTITRIDSNRFQLSDVGTYMVSWQVSINEPGQLILELNDIQISYTVVGRATGTSQISGNSLITTTSSNSILSVINPVGNATALTLTPFAGGTNSVSASLVITRIK